MLHQNPAFEKRFRVVDTGIQQFTDWEYIPSGFSDVGRVPMFSLQHAV